MSIDPNEYVPGSKEIVIQVVYLSNGVNVEINAKGSPTVLGWNEPVALDQFIALLQTAREKAWPR